MKVAFVGAAGGIGQTLSMVLKALLPAGSELALYDIAPATPGFGVDVSHIPTAVSVKGYAGEEHLAEALLNADVVVVTAGVARKPGMAREELLSINAGIIAGIMRSVAHNAPNAVILIATNPVNTIVPLAARVLKQEGCYKPERLLGATMLDTTRAAAFILEKTGISVDLADISVVCGHSDKTIVALLSSLPALKGKEDLLEGLYAHIAGAGTEVVKAKAGAGSATLSMAYATCITVFSIVEGLSGASDAIINTYTEHERFGLPFFAQKVRMGKNGIEEYLEMPSMNEAESAKLKDAVAQLSLDIAAAEGVKL